MSFVQRRNKPTSTSAQKKAGGTFRAALGTLSAVFTLPNTFPLAGTICKFAHTLSFHLFSPPEFLALSSMSKFERDILRDFVRDKQTVSLCQCSSVAGSIDRVLLEVFRKTREHFIKARNPGFLSKILSRRWSCIRWP